MAVFVVVVVVVVADGGRMFAGLRGMVVVDKCCRAGRLGKKLEFVAVTCLFFILCAREVLFPMVIRLGIRADALGRDDR